MTVVNVPVVTYDVDANRTIIGQAQLDTETGSAQVVLDIPMSDETTRMLETDIELTIEPVGVPVLIEPDPPQEVVEEHEDINASL